MEARVKKVQKLLKEQSLDAILISSTPNILYLSGYNGFTPEERDAYLLITKDQGYIFTNLLYSEAMETAVPHLELVEINRTNAFSTGLKNLVAKHKIQTLGFEDTNLTVAEYLNIKALDIKLKPADLIFLRSFKEPREIESIKKACALTDKAFTYILKEIKPGVSEIEIEKKLALYFAQHNADSSFRAVVAFGANTTIPHHLAGETKLKTNDVVLLDFGAKVDGYCADVSRTFFYGKATKKQKEIFQLVYDTQQQVIKQIQKLLEGNRPILSNEMDQLAREYIQAKNYPPFPYSLGHGLGLQGHERPFLNPRHHDVLSNGIAFTLEPGIHLSGEIGVRIEDVFVIDKGKLLQLSKSRSQLIEL